MRPPHGACVVLVDAGTPAADGTCDATPRAVRQALESGAPAVIVLCAGDAPLTRARGTLRALGQRLAPLAVEFGARVSRSATDGLAAWAASRAAPIGIDVQAAPAALDADLLGAALHADEQAWLAAQPDSTLAFAQLWAGKEAVLKAFGVGLAWSPREVVALPVANGWHGSNVPALGHAWLSRVVAPGGRRVAVAVALNAGFARPH
ncbi:MAG TPA: 4'-phosphopantetheinyl transferase superfamily protein [Burkholderiaceae bacterium]|nr:4'-phosphopantetheinyl transferase superfamily protein [Burkholderiaceae bacterium]